MLILGGVVGAIQAQEPGLQARRLASIVPSAPVALYRVLDQDNLSQIEFEAELFGFSELIRVITGKKKRNMIERNQG